MIDFNSEVEKCLTVLESGGVILYPTDTIWGLGCDATNADAVQRLIEIKGKPTYKGLIVLLASERDILKYVAAPDLEVFNYLSTVTKPTTVIYTNGLQVADDVLNQDGSIAIRIVQEEFCRHLLKRFKKPIVSTSANIHGQPSPQNFFSVNALIKLSVNYVVKLRQDEEQVNSASAIIKWINAAPVIIRS